jgi:fucose permease
VAVLLGAAAGMMDGGLNTAVALTGRRRLLNLLHGAYGVGTAIGPLLVTVAILNGSWRAAYLALVGFDLVLAGSWLLHWRHRRVETVDAGHASERGSVPTDPTDTLSRRRSAWVVTAGMTVFFVYTGLEVAAGQWEASYCRGHLGMSASGAGLATFGYWGALTAVRIALALLPRPLHPSTVVRWGSALAVVAAAAIWWGPTSAVAVAGFVVLGGALGGVFPALISLTPGRVGNRRAQHVIAWQVGAAAAGGSGISALIGLVIGISSLAVIGPAVTILAVVLVGTELILGRMAPVGAAPPAGAPS